MCSVVVGAANASPPHPTILSKDSLFFFSFFNHIYINPSHPSILYTPILFSFIISPLVVQPRPSFNLKNKPLLPRSRCVVLFILILSIYPHYPPLPDPTRPVCIVYLSVSLYFIYLCNLKC